MHDLTQSYIINRSKLSPVLLNNDELVHNQNAPFYLIIYSTNPTFTKISVYPVNQVPIIKYIIGGTFITPAAIEELSSIFQELSSVVIHSSGLVYSGNQYEYEIYLSGITQQITNLISKKIALISKIEHYESSKVRLY